MLNQELELVADIIINNEVSDNDEMIDSIMDNTTLFDRDDVTRLVTLERGNYLSGKYFLRPLAKDIELIKSYLVKSEV